MPRTRNPYPPEFREQLVALARAGRSVEDLAREFEVSRGVGLGAANMSGIYADDELFAAIAGKLHFDLTPFIRLRPCVPFFLCILVVDPLADPDPALA